MDHIAYIKNSCELEDLLQGKKSVIVRGARGRQLPYDGAHPGDNVYFVKDSSNEVVAKGIIKDAVNSAPLGKKDPARLISENIEKLGLGDKELLGWAKRKHILLIEFGTINRVMPFSIDFLKTPQRDWHPVGYINKIRKA